MYDLTTPDGVKALMESSTTLTEWNTNCDTVKTANPKYGRPEYPSFWYAVILASGLYARVSAKFSS